MFLSSRTKLRVADSFLVFRRGCGTRTHGPFQGGWRNEEGLWERDSTKAKSILKWLQVCPVLPRVSKLARQQTLESSEDECLLFAVI